MVKVGFIVEGDVEKKIIKSPAFQAFCKQQNIEVLRSMFPPKGRMGKDVFKDVEKLTAFINILHDQGAERIFVVRDLEDLDCVVEAKNEIASDIVTKIIVVKAIESWFLADTKAISAFFKSSEFYYQYPENIVKPFEEIRRINLEKTGRGLKDKLIFAGSMLNFGFSIENAAKHPNCHSATYFVNKLTQIAR